MATDAGVDTLMDITARLLPSPDSFMEKEEDAELTPDAVFVQEYLKSGDAKLACVRAGLSDSRYALAVIAERHLKRPEIQAAIAAVKALGVKRERVEYSRELLLDELQAIHDRSVETGQMTAAISALKEQSALLGYREQTVNFNVNVNPRELPLADLEAMVAKLAADRGVIEGEYSVVGIGNDAGPEKNNDEVS